jgi:hypothetical protein
MFLAGLRKLIFNRVPVIPMLESITRIAPEWPPFYRARTCSTVEPQAVPG